MTPDESPCIHPWIDSRQQKKWLCMTDLKTQPHDMWYEVCVIKVSCWLGRPHEKSDYLIMCEEPWDLSTLCLKILGWNQVFVNLSRSLVKWFNFGKFRRINSHSRRRIAKIKDSWSRNCLRLTLVWFDEVNTIRILKCTVCLLWCPEPIFNRSRKFCPTNTRELFSDKLLVMQLYFGTISKSCSNS